MKRALVELIIFAGFLALLFFTVTTVTYSPCDTPIPYRLGTVDARFGISNEDFSQDVANATLIWDNAEGKTLFSYNPKASLTISLIYDSRQQLTNEINNLQNNLDTQKGSIDQQIAQ